MNEIVNKMLLAGYKVIPIKHLKQPGFTYSACNLQRTKNKKSHKTSTKTSWIKLAFSIAWLMEILKI